MASTTTASPDLVVDLTDRERAWIVEHIADRCFAATLDHGTALLMLDSLGLTGDREVLSHALAARYMRDGIRDGSIDVRQVDPELTIGREAAVELLADRYDCEYDESIAKLAALRPLTVCGQPTDWPGQPCGLAPGHPTHHLPTLAHGVVPA